MKNECEQITSAINNDIKKKDNILPEENVVKMRREIKIHDKQKKKRKRKTNAKRRADENIDVSFLFKKKNRRRRKQNKTPVSQQGASNRSPNPSQSAFILLSCFLNFQ